MAGSSGSDDDVILQVGVFGFTGNVKRGRGTGAIESAGCSACPRTGVFGRRRPRSRDRRRQGGLLSAVFDYVPDYESDDGPILGQALDRLEPVREPLLGSL